MRTLAFGDVHGCLGALDALLAAAAPRADDHLIFLGDYIDRGPHSSGVLSRLIEIRKKFRATVLLGNHEQMFLGARNNQLLHREWLANGGDMTLVSYGSRNAKLTEIPAEHWAFLESLPLFLETETHLFVHAGVDPLLAMEEQPVYTLLWERYSDPPPPPHISGKTVVCGHTPGRGVRTCGHAICIDTGAFRPEGFLTCLDLTSGRIYQANQRGQVRGGALQELRAK